MIAEVKQFVCADPTVGWEEVTPGKAERWLSHNIDGNRKVSEQLVGMYAHDMSRGAWLTGNAQPIQFDGEMRLIDGQHRLAAVVKSGQTVRMLVARGVPTETIRAIDSGKKRSVADYLHMNGRMSANQLAAVGRAAFLWTRGCRGTAIFAPREAPTPQDIIDFIAEHHELDVVCSRAWPVYSKVRGCSMTVYALAYWLFRGIDVGATAEFFAQVESGADLSAGSPVHALRERLIREMGALRKTPRHMILAYFIKAWNSYHAGESRTILRLTDTEDYPEPV